MYYIDIGAGKEPRIYHVVLLEYYPVVRHILFRLSYGLKKYEEMTLDGIYTKLSVP